MSRIEDLGVEPDNLLPEDEVDFLEKEAEYLESLEEENRSETVREEN